jgi:tetratricopeptide (TPR) repeat protein
MIVTLVPVLNLIPIPWPIVVERFSYIPSIGFSLSVAFCWGRLMKRSAHPAIPLAGKVWAGVGIGVLFLFFLMTVNQNRIWGSDILLWEDTVRKAPHFAMGHMNLGNAYQESGQLEQAAQAYENSLKHVSPSPRLLHNLGTLYQNMGKTQKAEEIFLALVKQNLAVSGTFHNLGILYEEKDLNRSVVFYREELARNPKIYKTHVRLGKVLVRLEKKEEALKEFQEAIEIFSDKPEAYIHLGVLLKKMGRFQEAREVFIRYFNLENPEEKHSEIYLNAQKEFREVQRELGQVDP